MARDIWLNKELSLRQLFRAPGMGAIYRVKVEP